MRLGARQVCSRQDGFYAALPPVRKCGLELRAWQLPGRVPVVLCTDPIHSLVAHLKGPRGTSA